MSKNYMQNEKGTIVVLIALVESFIFGCAGLVVDLGNLYLQRLKM